MQSAESTDLFNKSPFDGCLGYFQVSVLFIYLFFSLKNADIQIGGKKTESTQYF